MKYQLSALLISLFLATGVANAQTPTPNNTVPKSRIMTPAQQNSTNPVQIFINKNDNVLFYMEEAIKQNDVTHADYEALFTRWGQIKQVLMGFKRNPKKYDPSFLSEFQEQEELFSDYVKTVYTMLVNEAATLNKLNFRFDVENLNLVIMVPQVTDEVSNEFKRSNYLNQSSSKFKEIVDLGFKEVKITDGRKTVVLVKTSN